MKIAIEGIDGSGKSLQAEMLATRLGADLIKQPSTGPVGQLIRQALLSGDFNDRTMFLLFAADRAHLVRSLSVSSTCVLDRHVLSNVAYHQVELAWALDVEWDIFEPELTILLDVPVHVGTRRVCDREGVFDTYEEHVRMVRAWQTYDTLFQQRKEDCRYVRVDGVGSVEDVHERIVQAVNQRIRIGHRAEYRPAKSAWPTQIQPQRQGEDRYRSEYPENADDPQSTPAISNLVMTSPLFAYAVGEYVQARDPSSARFKQKGLITHLLDGKWAKYRVEWPDKTTSGCVGSEMKLVADDADPYVLSVCLPDDWYEVR